MDAEMQPMAAREPKRAFLCHASEDRQVAHQIAHSLQGSGIETFFDEWEMRAGDSLRRKIDAGLTGCTHFIALLTPQSIHKPWVEAEMDAAFVRKVEGLCRFIPLRMDLSYRDLPPLLAGLFSRETGSDYDADIANLVSDIFEVSRRPTLGQRPDSAAPAELEPDQIGLSVAASHLVEQLLRQSKNGMLFDPQLSVEQVREATSMTDDDIQDGAEELESLGLVRFHRHARCGPLGFDSIWPKDELFVELDAQMMDWNPEADALRIAADLVADSDGSANVQELAERYGWEPRRLNPAINYLEIHELAMVGKYPGTMPYTASGVRKTSATRRFVRDNS